METNNKRLWTYGILGTFATLGVAYWVRERLRAASREELKHQADVSPATYTNDDKWDAIDEAAWESFPSSDPPPPVRRTTPLMNLEGV